MVFGHCDCAEERSRADTSLHIESCWAQLKRSGVAQIATLLRSLLLSSRLIAIARDRDMLIGGMVFMPIAGGVCMYTVLIAGIV